MIELTRRDLLAAVVTGAALSPASLRDDADAVRPEQFGARGDGVSNDTEAFLAMAAHVNAKHGGTMVLRAVTYLVGHHIHNAAGGYGLDGATIMHFVGCSGPVVIEGNGARLRCAPGLRYGVFGASGERSSNGGAYAPPGDLATPYRAMIRAESCLGVVQISDLELDGNLEKLIVGGRYGDSGWQIPAVGVDLVGNSGTEVLKRVHAHHHPLDGILIDGIDRPRAGRSSFEDVHSDHNGRQGLSITGGGGYDFKNCRFTDAGRSVIASAPAAGVDIEAEAGKSVRDLSFTGCLFSNNRGCGMVADSGPSQRVTFNDCTFVGSANWAAWPNKPQFRFNRCTFVGPIVHAYGDIDRLRACQFHHCSFLDDPALSPTGQLYGGENPSRPIADLPGNRNVLFEGCRFSLTHRAVLPWSVDVIFSNCTMSQRAPVPSYPRGTFTGRNVINGKVDLYGSKVHGVLIVNGKTIPPNG